MTLLCSSKYSPPLQDDVITLGMVQQQLTECCSQHAVICSAPNNFTVTERFGITNVILSCEVSTTSRYVYRGWYDHVMC